MAGRKRRPEPLNPLKTAIRGAEAGWRLRVFMVAGFLARAYCVIMTPFELAFCTAISDTMHLIGIVASIITCIDIILHEGIIYAHSSHPALQGYLFERLRRSLLGVEFFAALPLHLLLPRSFLVLRLALLPCLDVLARYMQASLQHRYFRVFRTFLYAIYWCHLVACIFFFTARMAFVKERTWMHSRHADFITGDVLIMYISSLYFAMTMLSTVGFGDMSPKNPVEEVLFVVIMGLNFAMAANEIGGFLEMRREDGGAGLEGDYLTNGWFGAAVEEVPPTRGFPAQNDPRTDDEFGMRKSV